MRRREDLMLRSALAYAQRFGWSVFPVRPGSKEPHGRLVRRGFHDATRDPKQIEMWWRAEPDAPVAIACVTSALVVLDVDRRNGGDETFGRLQRGLGPLPTTPTCLTPGPGLHLYFRDSVGGYLGTAGDGVDVKSAGYVLAPPSIHPTGCRYIWDAGAHPTDTAIAELPDAWLAHITARPKATALASSGTDAADSWLGQAFESARWLGDVLPDGKRMARCPWLHEHTDGRGDGSDSSTVIFPKAEGHTLGGFRCAHAHCSGRSWRDVVDVLPATAKRAADDATAKERNQRTLEQIAKLRKAVGW